SGGAELDHKLLKFLVEDFMNENQVDIIKDKQAMSKFRKEANRLKVVLSTNDEAISTAQTKIVQIKGVYKGIDYSREIKRSQFEATADDLKVRFVIPLHTCLVKAGLTFEDVTSVILMGGASQTPMIQRTVKATVGEGKVAFDVNADEAAVIGASLSRQVKTKDIEVSDICMYDIQASYTADPEEGGPSKIITSTIFPPSSKAGSTKTLTFKKKDDFSISDHSQGIFEAKISGVAEAIANLTEKGVLEPVIKTTITLSESGFVSVSDAIAIGEVEQDLIKAHTVKSSRDTISLRRSDGTEWAVEELIAMQFSHVKELAESVAGEKVKDVTVTVPPFYTQAEHDAVVDAAEIADLRTLALVNDGTAVTINYAMTRTFPEPEIHVIYDPGASAIQTTLVEFSTVESTGKGKPKPYTQVRWSGIGSQIAQVPG
ncbi:actin-like ATPase domain-containing protein, partial [Thelephora ganbajun]